MPIRRCARATPGWSPRICASARRWTIARRQTPNWKSPCAARLPSRAASSASRESSGRLAGAAVAVSRRALDAFRQCGGRRGSGRRAGKRQVARSGARKRAERIEERDSERNLLLFRLESLLSWSEHLALDRCSDDEDDPDGARVAEDLDYLSLSRQRTQKGGGLRLDLDLPAADYDDLPLGPGLKLPEWDYRQQRLLSDHVLLQPMRPRGATSASLPAHLEKTALHLRRQFACLRDGRQRLRQQPQGDEIDLDAWLDFQVERRRGGSTQPGLFLEQRPRRRDLACLLLADLSMSTEAYLDDQRRVIDSIVDSLLLFGEALQALGDPFALYGFSSVRRQQVRWQVLKDFDEGYGGEVRGRVLALSPGYYTRMGAAIRRASQVLCGQPQKRRLLLLLSDGKPNDLDRYEGRYGIEDTRQAVIEARSQGLVPFCITIDKEAADYLPTCSAPTASRWSSAPGSCPSACSSSIGACAAERPQGTSRGSQSIMPRQNSASPTQNQAKRRCRRPWSWRWEALGSGMPHCSQALSAPSVSWRQYRHWRMGVLAGSTPPACRWTGRGALDRDQAAGLFTRSTPGVRGRGC